MFAEYLMPFPTVMFCTGARRTGSSVFGPDLDSLHAARHNPSTAAVHVRKTRRIELTPCTLSLFAQRFLELSLCRPERQQGLLVIVVRSCCGGLLLQHIPQ